MAEWLSALIFHYRALTIRHIAVSGVGSSPTRGTCETSQVLLADVSGGLCSVFSHPMTGPSQMSGNNFERDVKLNQKYSKQYLGELVSSPDKNKWSCW